MGKGEPSRAHKSPRMTPTESWVAKVWSHKSLLWDPPEQRNHATGWLSPLPGGDGAAPLLFVDGVHKACALYPESPQPIPFPCNPENGALGGLAPWDGGPPGPAAPSRQPPCGRGLRPRTSQQTTPERTAKQFESPRPERISTELLCHRVRVGKFV